MEEEKEPKKEQGVQVSPWASWETLSTMALSGRAYIQTDALLRDWGGCQRDLKPPINQNIGSKLAVETRHPLPWIKSVSSPPTPPYSLLNSVSLMALNQAKKLYRWISPTESQEVMQLQEPALAFKTRRVGCPLPLA